MISSVKVKGVYKSLKHSISKIKEKFNRYLDKFYRIKNT